MPDTDSSRSQSRSGLSKADSRGLSAGVGGGPSSAFDPANPALVAAAAVAAAQQQQQQQQQHQMAALAMAAAANMFGKLRNCR